MDPVLKVVVLEPPGGEVGNAHVRLGWGRREANLDAPVGLDGYSYGIRDVGGEKIHLSRLKSYGRSFGSGDVVGCLIRLPERRFEMEKIKRKRVSIRFKGQLYFESDEYTTQKEMEALVDREGKGAKAAEGKEVNGNDTKPKKGGTKNAKKAKIKNEPSGPFSRALPTLDGSRIEFFLNGESLGTAFTDLYDYAPLPLLATHSTPGKKHDIKEALADDGTLGYYPMISCFGKGKARLNFGSPWLAPPPGLTARGVSERWEVFQEEERMLDERDEADTIKRLHREAQEEEVRRQAAEAKAAAVLARGGEPNLSRGGRGRGRGAKKRGRGRDERWGSDSRTPTDEVSTPGPTSGPTPGPDESRTSNLHTPMKKEEVNGDVDMIAIDVDAPAAWSIPAIAVDEPGSRGDLGRAEDGKTELGTGLKVEPEIMTTPDGQRVVMLGGEVKIEETNDEVMTNEQSMVVVDE